ncbi:MAG TPA: FecR family protein, partial [Holophagaceae bacterium]|nr:FecR family protein [Holophagaceae bacterium]
MRDHLRIPALLALTLPGIVCPAPAHAQDRDQAPDEDTYQGEAPERYARVRALEGEVRIRKGELDEELSRGTPIGEGDVVESKGRGVVQLLDGTRIAFGGATRFTVAALFKDAKGERQVLLRLDQGRLRVTLGGESEAKFRIDTPSGQVTCFDKGTFSVEIERDHTLRVKVHAGRVTVRNERDEARIGGGERITVYGAQDRLDRVRDFNTYEEDEFDRWSDRSTVVRRGESWERVPAELRHYSDDLDGNGEWVHSDEYGWVWKPAVTDDEWRPYWRGRWAAYPGGMTWVSDEPWGYVTYHHGRWSWGAGLGWYWIPGVYYSPAWVAWRYNDGYCGWAPLNYYNAPCDWGYGAWHGYGCWNVVSVNYINVYNVGGRCYRDRTVIGAFHP